MATYKVLQDIEAEDKFVGPLTLKQFILAGIAFVCAYLSFFFLTKHLWILVIPLLPVMLAAGFLAFPWRRDQPTEIWLLAKIRFLLKPRRRIWDQTGMQELVTITAPKHVEQYVGDNLSQTEVRSRLRALAETIDSRGWAVKNINVNLVNAAAVSPSNTASDRLIDMNAFAREVPSVDVHAADDILDEKSNPIAQHLNQMINASSQTHRQATLQNMRDVRDHKHAHKPAGGKAHTQPPSTWFMNASDDSKTPADGGHTSPTHAATPKHKGRHVAGGKSTSKHGANRGHATSPKPLNPAILNLANNDDLTVATIARQANQERKPGLPSDEVVVPLR